MKIYASIYICDLVGKKPRIKSVMTATYSIYNHIRLSVKYYISSVNFIFLKKKHNLG